MTGSSCGLGATKLASVHAPPWDFLLAQAAQPLLLLDSGLRHSPLPRSELLLTPVCPSHLSLGAPRRPRPSRPRRAPGLVTRLEEPVPGSPPPTPWTTEPHVGLSSWPRPAIGGSGRSRTRCDWLSAGVGMCDSFTRVARVSQSRKHNRSHRSSRIQARCKYRQADGEEVGGKGFAKGRRKEKVHGFTGLRPSATVGVGMIGRRPSLCDLGQATSPL